MEAGKDDDPVLFDDEKQAVWKSGNSGTPAIRLDHGEVQGISG